MYSVQLKSTDYGISWIQGSISSSGRKLSPPQNTQLLFNVYWWSCPCGVMWPAHEADSHLHLMPSLRISVAIPQHDFKACTWTSHWHTVLLHVLTYKKKFPFKIPICLFQKSEESFSKMVPISIYKASKQVSFSKFHCGSGHDFKTTATFNP